MAWAISQVQEGRELLCPPSSCPGVELGGTQAGTWAEPGGSPPAVRAEGAWKYLFADVHLQPSLEVETPPTLEMPTLEVALKMLRGFFSLWVAPGPCGSGLPAALSN